MFDRNNTIMSYRLRTVESIKRAKKGLQVFHPIEPWIYLKRSKTNLSGSLEEELMKELYNVFTIYDKDKVSTIQGEDDEDDEDVKIIPVITENLILSFDYFDTKTGWYRTQFRHYDCQVKNYVKYKEKEIDYDAINLFASLAVKYKRAKNIFFSTYNISMFSVINPQKLNMPCVFLKKDGQIEFIEKKITTKQLNKYDTDIQVPDYFKHYHITEVL